MRACKVGPFPSIKRQCFCIGSVHFHFQVSLYKHTCEVTGAYMPPLAKKELCRGKWGQFVIILINASKRKSVELIPIMVWFLFFPSLHDIPVKLLEIHSVEDKTSKLITNVTINFTKYKSKALWLNIIIIFTKLSHLWSRTACGNGAGAFDGIQTGFDILPTEREAVAIRISNIFTHIITASKHFCGGYFFSVTYHIQVLETFVPLKNYLANRPMFAVNLPLSWHYILLKICWKTFIKFIKTVFSFWSC